MVEEIEATILPRMLGFQSGAKAIEGLEFRSILRGRAFKRKAKWKTAWKPLFRASC